MGDSEMKMSEKRCDNGASDLKMNGKQSFRGNGANERFGQENERNKSARMVIRRKMNANQ